MTNITETNTFPANVARYDTADPVVGGLTGESNLPIIAMANRTRYLYNAVNGFDGVTTITGNTTITTAHLRKMVLVNVSANTTLTISAGSGFIVGQRLSFIVKTTGVRSVGFVLSGGDAFLNLYAPFTGLWLHNNEEIALVWTGSGWWIEDINTNLKVVANDGMARRLPQNTAVAQGTGGLLRADYARLWDVLNATASLVVTEATWLSALANQGFFTSGNTTTTLRLPDMRSMSWRGLDGGRNLSLTRSGTNAGAYEADGNKSHNHTNGAFNLILKADGTFTTAATDNSVAEPNVVQSAALLASGGAETTVKNIGLTPFIYY